MHRVFIRGRYDVKGNHNDFLFYYIHYKSFCNGQTWILIPFLLNSNTPICLMTVSFFDSKTQYLQKRNKSGQALGFIKNF
ncbi:hypothetical protein A2U94_13630 [Bacillus sp. VT 712]|uniref:Uncharacterized protein n=1 Tax=Priestia veravalensis TaxID=1414648 RepID=A0A0V8JJW1_9BACI|nr:hypothetical protein BC359_08355 [Priestia flexa]KSU86960.1 hypothetical protein AS180_15615 [Priestia veravalensis]KZB90886.1 hypothetical protein A2U94_13630 [Bacillus sp. VT 712]RIV11495.1 hypothetical protein D1859_07505 [Priestia flexa]